MSYFLPYATTWLYNVLSKGNILLIIKNFLFTKTSLVSLIAPHCRSPRRNVLLIVKYVFDEEKASGVRHNHMKMLLSQGECPVISR